MSQFKKDLSIPFSINNNVISRGAYNLIITKRDVHLYSVGIMPNRNFKISDVKKYFEIKGNKEAINKQINEMVNRYKLGEYSKYEKQ